MLKRSGAFLLAMIYCITVTGFVLNLHYCGQLLSSVKINQRAQGCGMYAAKAMKCCKDKTIDVKVKDAHQNVASLLLSKAPAFCPVHTTFLTAGLVNGHYLNSRPLLFSSAKAPPGCMPVYLKNCIFRI